MDINEKSPVAVVMMVVGQFQHYLALLKSERNSREVLTVNQGKRLEMLLQSAYFFPSDGKSRPLFVCVNFISGGHANYHCRRITSKRTILIAFIIILPFLITIIVLAVLRGVKSNQTSPDVNYSAVLGPACPTGWIVYGGKCYFFSEEKRNWASAQRFCISQGSSLAKIQSELEKVFMFRFKGDADHWIGLRKDFNDTWIWADGSEYSNR
ncbi:C-type lectin domain family 2 member D-like [Podarcis raffonei]|uniref:C-type lectin domain family 2 member D-like n=1 Tax=Podarcis raffonei TaxID=65483 RepID=UPI0023298E61|nr:C-type lectin domain family 2 member D-like [Podarcis raffonei]